MVVRDRIEEVTRYAFVSSVGFAADVATLWLLAVYLSIHYLASAAIGFIIGGFIVYALSIRYVFRFRRLSSVSIESTTFVAIGIVGLAVNTGAIFIAVNFAGIELLSAKLIASSMTLLINYLLRKFALFSPLPNTRTEPHR